MSSEAQKAANRRNAQKSTGPKTQEGKQIAAQNARQHGLTAQLVTFDESDTAFAAFRSALTATLAPADAIEEELVERIVLCAWRLRRAGRMEAALINSFSTITAHVPGTELALPVFRAAFAMTTLSRYEVSLDRAMQRAQMMLERYQARRRGESVLAPVAVTGLEALDGASSLTAQPENYETKPILEAASPAAAHAAECD